MKLRKAIGRLLKRTYLDGAARGALAGARRFSEDSRRRFGAVDRDLIEGYLRTHSVRKLQIGCGSHTFDGWLNADLAPSSGRVLRLDATMPFPMEDEQFDYVFSEHMIEHISHAQGLHMLSECYRIMKPGGRIRISTPDLAFLFDLYRGERSPLQIAYLKWSAERYLGIASPPFEALVINNFVRDWGHQFIYDVEALDASMRVAGFVEIANCQLKESTDPALRDLENDSRMPNGFLRLETLTLEGVKPN